MKEFERSYGVREGFKINKKKLQLLPIDKDVKEGARNTVYVLIVVLIFLMLISFV